MFKHDLFVYLTLPFIVCFLLVVYCVNFTVGWTLHQITRLNAFCIHRTEIYWQRYVCYLQECENA